MIKKIVWFIICLMILGNSLYAGSIIKIDAYPDSIYSVLRGPEDGHLIISHNDFLPYSGPKPAGDNDLSAKLWMTWDDEYLYVYAEITDDVIRVNNNVRPHNDCIELKFDPDPTQMPLIGIVNARLSALDSVDVEENYFHAVDNMYSERYLDTSEVSCVDYARRITEKGYAVEMRLKWDWITAEGRHINVGVGNIFGFAVNIHDNDSNQRDGSIQWSTGMADEIWITPQLLGTAEFLTNHKIKLIKKNAIDPQASPGTTYLSKSRIEKWPGPSIVLENWKYQSGDNPQWADPDFDDSEWEIVHPLLRKDRMPESGWDNIGWFRIKIVVDSSLHGVPLGLNLDYAGAADLYLNGDSLYQFGTVTAKADSERTYWERKPRYIVFRNQSDYLLAIRYSNTATEKLHNMGAGAGFECLIEENFNSFVDRRIDVFRIFSIYGVAFVVIPVLLGLIHLFIFAFYPRTKEHLYFSITTFCWALIAFGDFQGPFITSLEQAINLLTIHMLAIAPAIIFGLLTLYSAIYDRIPKQIWIFIIAGAVVTIWSLIQLISYVLAMVIYGIIGLGTLEIFRIMLFSGFQKWQGRWLTLVGFAVFMVVLVYQIVQNFIDLPRLGEYGIIYVYGLLVLSICVSLDLSRKFARTNRDLELQLDQVKKLSHKAIEQERKVRKEEIARKLLEADHQRKTKELEEARQLQLSMLPREIPAPDHLEIAARMKTANEVGGDYYDFYLAQDNTLTVAIGDATGHGMRAGTMVASIKSLFAAFGNHMDISRFFNRCTEIIKEMHMGNIFMGMMLVRFNGKSMTAAAAGLPPIFIYRAATGKVDEMVLKGMPLGAHRDFKYTEKKTSFSPGDTILLMTDGYTELFNEQKEMLDYGRVKEYFLQNAAHSPEKIIEELIRNGETWRGNEPQADDYTFVVIKVKPEYSVSE
jgi:serine phosphatase RsbU (regulator of sigma subunit)